MILSFINFFQSTESIIDLLVAIIFIAGLSVFIYQVSRRFIYCFVFIILALVFCLFNILGFSIASYLLLLTMISLFAFFFSSYSAKIFTIFNKKRSKIHIDDEFYTILESTVVTLSKTKTGALITFEKDENLDEYIEKGKPVHAPVNIELLRTIFYNGTPLHDGAVIVRDKNIEAASVYFNPTTRAMPGKYGARHRAAIGFSERHSSITVVVSEETGRINFAVAGELIPVSHDTFKKRLKGYLED